MRIGQRRRGMQTAGQALLALAGLAFVGWVIYRSQQTTPEPWPPPPRAVAPTAHPGLAPPAAPGSGTNRPVPGPSRDLTTQPGIAPELAASAAAEAVGAPRPVANVLEAQIALARRGFSSGSIDGVLGYQTRAALRAFQRQAGLPVTGALDAATRARLTLEPPALTVRVITTNDLARLLPVSPTWLGKSRQPRLDFASLLELVAEEHRVHPELVRRLNPGVDWDNVRPGQTVQVPDVAYPAPAGSAAWVSISLSGRTLQVFGAASNLLAHFPCSIAARVEKRPLGELRVTAIAPDPNYTFNPEVFPESAEARTLGRKLILPPGPNNPVGTAWISLDRPGYGIHGTPVPEQVGRTESHGCFRLANWNAAYLLRLVTVGTPVRVEP